MLLIILMTLVTCVFDLRQIGDTSSNEKATGVDMEVGHHEENHFAPVTKLRVSHLIVIGSHPSWILQI